MDSGLETLFRVVEILALIAAVWALGSLLAWIIWKFLQRIFPLGGLGTARLLVSKIRPRDAFFDRMRSRVANARQNVFGPPAARLILESKHRKLHTLLKQERDRLDERLKGIEDSAIGGGGAELQKLMRDFHSDVEKATNFEGIDDDLVNDTVELKRLRRMSTPIVLVSVAVGAANFWLLREFFDSLFGGLQLRAFGYGVLVANIPALMLPLIEAGTGIGLAANLNIEQAAKTTLRSALILFVLALAAGEYVMFYILFSSGNGPTPGTTLGNVTPAVFGAVGFAITGILAIFSYLGSVVRDQIAAKSTLLDVKANLAACNEFVDRLPERMQAIQLAAGKAGKSIDNFRAELEGRGAIAEKIGDTIDQYREMLIAAIEDVNPEHFQSDPEALAGDNDALVRAAWGWAPGLAAMLAMFTFLGGRLIEPLGLGVISIGLWPYIFAFMAGVVGLVAGSLAFDRVGVTQARKGKRYDIISPRDVAFRILAGLIVGGVTTALLTAGWMTGGRAGAVEASLLAAFYVAFVALGSLHDHLFKGIDFLARSSLAVAVFIVEALWWTTRAAALGVAAAAVWTVDFLVTLIAYPVLLITERFGRRHQAPAPAVA